MMSNTRLWNYLCWLKLKCLSKLSMLVKIKMSFILSSFLLFYAHMYVTFSCFTFFFFSFCHLHVSWSERLPENLFCSSSRFLYSHQKPFSGHVLIYRQFLFFFHEPNKYIFFTMYTIYNNNEKCMVKGKESGDNGEGGGKWE